MLQIVKNGLCGGIQVTIDVNKGNLLVIIINEYWNCLVKPSNNKLYVIPNLRKAVDGEFSFFVMLGPIFRKTTT